MPEKNKVLIGAVGAASAGFAAWRTFFPYIADDYRTIRASWKVALSIWKDLNTDNRLIDMFEKDVEKHPTKPFILFEDKIYTNEYVENDGQQNSKYSFDLGRWSTRNSCHDDI